MSLGSFEQSADDGGGGWSGGGDGGGGWSGGGDGGDSSSPSVSPWDGGDGLSAGGEGDDGVPEWVVPVVATATLLPFLQALATQAGNGAYEAARRGIRKLVERESETSMSGAPQMIIEVAEGELRFVVPHDLSDAALEALTRADLEQLAAPDADGGEVTIWWDAASGEWRRQVQ